MTEVWPPALITAEFHSLEDATSKALHETTTPEIEPAPPNTTSPTIQGGSSVVSNKPRVG